MVGPSNRTSGLSAAANDQIVILVVLALLVFFLGWLALRRRAVASDATPEPGPAGRRDSTGWRSNVLHLCAEGRRIVELTTARTPGEPGSGLSLAQLGYVESQLDALIAQLGDVEIGAPTPLVAQSLRMASVEADNLNGLVQTERRLRLTSVHPSTALLDATALQLSKARSSLDQALREVSQSIAELGR